MSLLLALLLATNPAVTQRTIGATICAPGWAATARPPKWVTGAIKHQLLAGRPAADYELDHIIPIELGGALQDRHNLVLQPLAGVCGAHAKDRLENRLRALTCARQVTLRRAQREITRDWLASYRARIGPLVCP